LIFLIAKQYTARYFIKKGRDKLRTIELDENLVGLLMSKKSCLLKWFVSLKEAMDALDENQRNLLRLFYQDNCHMRRLQPKLDYQQQTLVLLLAGRSGKCAIL